MLLKLGSCIGVIGGGQLGRMFVLECRRMGYRTAVLDQDPESPAAQVADLSFSPESVDEFTRACELATYEFEHVDIRVVRAIEEEIAVFPSSAVLEIKQSREAEKTFLSGRGFPVPKFWILKDGKGLDALAGKHALVAKLSRGGYDGKGLFIIKTPHDYEAVRADLAQDVVAEQFVPFEKEISVVCARDRHGNTAFFPVVENVHDNGILLSTLAPARIDASVAARAQTIAQDLAHALDLVGVLCVELFLTKEGDLLINEFAPRPHNSGHYSMDGCDISQFEMLLRVLGGLPLPRPRLLCPTGMLNIFGVDPAGIDLGRLLAIEGTKLHLYGKKDVRDRRKMGHVNVLARTVDEAIDKLDRIKSIVYPNAGG